MNGSLYFTTQEPFSVISFDVGAGGWEEIPVELPGELTFMRLVGGEEEEEEEASAGDKLQDQKRKKSYKLFLVGGLGSDGISKRLKVWEMRSVGEDGVSEWAAVGILPELMCRKFVSVCYHNYEHVYCLWQDGLIGVSCYTWPEMLVYDVQKQSWRWVEKCSLLQDKWSCDFRWFSFAPNLCAAA